MTDKTVTVVVTASCENGGQQQNCIDCPHFCGVKMDELRDSYVVECGYKPTKKGQCYALINSGKETDGGVSFDYQKWED